MVGLERIIVFVSPERLIELVTFEIWLPTISVRSTVPRPPSVSTSIPRVVVTPFPRIVLPLTTVRFVDPPACCDETMIPVDWPLAGNRNVFPVIVLSSVDSPVSAISDRPQTDETVPPVDH